jgi:hypothetical protein
MKNNFFRVIRNFIIDTFECTTDAVAGIHWQVAQGLFARLKALVWRY